MAPLEQTDVYRYKKSSRNKTGIIHYHTNTYEVEKRVVYSCQSTCRRGLWCPKTALLAVFLEEVLVLDRCTNLLQRCQTHFNVGVTYNSTQPRQLLKNSTLLPSPSFSSQDKGTAPLSGRMEGCN